MTISFLRQRATRTTRAIALGFVIVALLAACSAESPEPTRADTNVAQPDNAAVRVQLEKKPEITIEKILKDVVGKNVSVQDAAGEAQPMDWMFEENEPKDAKILERKATDKGVSVVIQMSTSGAPGSDDANIQLSGRLVLHYDWNGRDWVLRQVQNQTFRYTRRLLI